MEFVGVFAELLEVEFLLGLELAVYVWQGNVDDEFALEGAAADENREAVATAVREREEDADGAAVDFDGEVDAVAELLLTHGATNDEDLIILTLNDFAAVERAGGAEEGELQGATLVNLDV